VSFPYCETKFYTRTKQEIKNVVFMFQTLREDKYCELNRLWHHVLSYSTLIIEVIFSPKHWYLTTRQHVVIIQENMIEGEQPTCYTV
jgi:hypothetical protein